MSKNICNICSACSEQTPSANYVKPVDPPTQNYGTILGDASQQDRFRQMPTPAESLCPNSNAQSQRESIIQVPSHPVKPCEKLVCEPHPSSLSTNVSLIKSRPASQRIWLNSLLMFLLVMAFVIFIQKADFSEGGGVEEGISLRLKCLNNKQTLQSVCLPVSGSTNQECPVAKLMVCLPCPPPVSYTSNRQTKEDCSFPFGVPQKTEGDAPQRSAAKYLPPPEKRICPPNCIHKEDLKGDKPCTWHAGIPCIAHCFRTPLRN